MSYGKFNCINSLTATRGPNSYLYSSLNFRDYKPMKIYNFRYKKKKEKKMVFTLVLEVRVEKVKTI